MARINQAGYLERMEYSHKNPHSKGSYMDWWLVKYNNRNNCQISLHPISIPNKYAGKRVRLKITIEEVKNGCKKM